jgi:hypothetical protein
MSTDHTADEQINRPSPPVVEPETCPEAPLTHWHEIIDNLPYLAMILIGAAIFWISLDAPAWRWISTGLYFVYGVGGAFWIMLFVCPYCHFYDTRLCPCGYGQIAAKLRAKKDGDRFAAQFRKHIPVIVRLWFLPLVAGGIPLFRDFSWVLAVLLLVFAVNSFAVLPLVSRKYGCAQCPQKEACPWMRTCRTEAA